MSVSSGTPLTELDILGIIQSLTGDLAGIEDKMLVAWRDGDSKISRTQSGDYHTRLNELVERLRNISSTLFNETEISKVKPYHSSELIPDNFRQYLNVSANISMLVAQDILYQPDLDHALATLERWIYVCKISFHKHDFFTASCVINGLNSSAVLSAKLENQLRTTSGDLLKYYQNMLDKSSLLYHRQNELLKLRLEVIPTLNTLTNIHEKIGSQPADSKKHSYSNIETTVRRRSVSKNFSGIKKKNSFQLNNIDKQILLDLSRKAESSRVDKLNVRSDNIKKLVIFEQNKLQADKKTTKPFSISSFSRLNDLRVDLIRMRYFIEGIENDYNEAISSILYNVKTLISDATQTDRQLFAKINEEFLFTSYKIDDKLTKIHKKIFSILLTIIKEENLYGKYFQREELKLTDSLEDHTSYSSHVKSKKKSKKMSKHSSHKKNKNADTPSIVESHSQEVSIVGVVAVEPLKQELVEQNITVIEPLADIVNEASSRQEPHKRELSMNLVPDISSSILMLGESFAPPSVRSELDDLLSSRSMTKAKTLYEQLIEASISDSSSQQNTPHSTRTYRSGSSTARFFIKNSQSNGRVESLSARIEESAKEPTLTNSAGTGIK